MKFLLISHVLPPSWSGQAMILYRLLSHIDRVHFCVASCQEYSDGGNADDHSRKLPVKYYRLPGSVTWRGSRFKFLKLYSLIRLIASLVARTLKIISIARAEKCDRIVVCSGDFLDLPAAYLASRCLKASLHVYLFDDYTYQWVNPKLRNWARYIEPTILRNAKRVIVPNEFLRDELEKRHNITATIIRNACDLTVYQELPTHISHSHNDIIRIVYTGAIYDAHYDAFRHLVDALKKLEILNIKLFLYTAQSPEILAQNGISGPVVVHPHQTIFSIPKIQQEADILFLPLAFESPYPEIIRTSCPGKLGEYLAAGRPILAHAPADSFVSWYLRQYRCGVVVDERESNQLEQSIREIISGKDLQKRLTKNAWMQAQSDFNLKIAREDFARILGISAPQES